MLVSDFMSTCTAECTEDTPVEQVYDLMQKCDHGFVIVIDSESHRVPLGLVSEHSICEQIVGKGRKLRGLTAGSVLDGRIKKVPDTATAEECSTLFESTKLAAVVVVNNKGGLCGIIPSSSFDAIKAAAHIGLPAAQSHIGSREFSEFPGLRWVH